MKILNQSNQMKFLLLAVLVFGQRLDRASPFYVEEIKKTFHPEVAANASDGE